MINEVLVGVLLLTVPAMGQNRYSDPIWGPDSIMVECSGGGPVEVDSIKLYKWLNGDFRFYRAWYVRGLEGRPFTTDSVSAGQYTARAKNQYGESCSGNIVTVGSLSSVPVFKVVEDKVKYFDVRGRYVGNKPPKAKGVYYKKKVKLKK